MAAGNRTLSLADLLLGKEYQEQRAALLGQRALERERHRVALGGLGIVFENRESLAGILEELAWKEQLSGEAISAYLQLLNPALDTVAILASVFAHAAALGQLAADPGTLTLSLGGVILPRKEISLAASGESGLRLLWWSLEGEFSERLAAGADLLAELGEEAVPVPEAVAVELRQLIAS